MFNISQAFKCLDPLITAGELGFHFLQTLVHHRQLAGLGLPFLGKGMQLLPLCQDICTNKQYKLT